jgi:predicted oxidoreductase
MHTKHKVPIVLGFMRASNLTIEEIHQNVDEMLSHGYNYFDHADIYGGGKSEEVFGSFLEKYPEYRKRIILQSKCGIVPGEPPMYNLSKDYILKAVDGILKRLHTDYLDILLLHRPDPLMDAEEVKEAFDILEKEKKVLHFGVSNFSSSQIEYLQKHLHQKIEYNQLQLSLVYNHMLHIGDFVNTDNPRGIDRDGYVMDYCKLQDITIQCWSPIQYGFFTGTFLNNPNYKELNEYLQILKEKYQVEKSTIAISYLLMIPMSIQVVIGSQNLEHIKEYNKIDSVNLTREEWYTLTKLTGVDLP